MRKLVTCIYITLVVFPAGCLLLECGADDNEGNKYFYDRIGDLILMGREDDLYVERLDSGKSRKVTSTPDIAELDAFFAHGGAMIAYKAERKKSAFDKTPSYEYNLFMQPTDKTDLEKTQIDYFLYRDLKKERVKQRDRDE